MGSKPAPGLAESILNELPELIDPRNMAAVLFTLRKWFPKKEPVDVLRLDPDLIRRAQRCAVCAVLAVWVRGLVT